MNRISYFAGVAAGFRDMIRAPGLQNPEDLIHIRLHTRRENFLELMRCVVFSDPAHPYCQMFRIAGCSYEDLEAAVNRDGLEATLTMLRRAGVYLAHDEFKLKTPIVRSNQVIAADEDSFRSPLSRGRFIGLSGGSRSGGTRVQASTAARVYREAYDKVMIDEFDLTRRHQLLLKPILPAIDGIANAARAARLGCTIDRWFSPVARSADSTHYRLATYSLVALARAHRVRLPFPSHLPLNDFSPVARWIAARRHRGIATIVTTYASPAVRVAAASRDLGLSIEGTLFLVGGETLTDAKRAVIESAGAEVFTRYSISELGAVGHACRHMTTGDCAHLFSDSIAAIPHRRPAPLSAAPVDSLLFTSLQLHAPFVFINVEMDDSGVISQEPDCPCRYAKLGFTTVIRNISSFGKLTGHGVTLVGTDILRILEHALPARFGGSATDYQLVEHDGVDQARLTLRVSRRVPLASVDEVKDRFLHEVRACYGGQMASRLWRDAGAVEVVHQDPIATGRGKLLSLHVLGSGGSSVAPHEP